MCEMTIGRRLDGTDAMRLLRDMPMGELMNRAHAARVARHPQPVVTFVCDTNPNYTNICVTGCRFCAFSRPPGDEEAFTLSPEELAARVSAAADRGATTVLLQGGHNPAIGLDEWIRYIRAIREACPTIHVHPFSPSEILFVAERDGMEVKDVLLALRAEGIDTMPGGGAEILSDRVRSVIAGAKCSADQWLAVMEQAHQLGFSTTATMMYGHVETDEELIGHLLRLRDLQDRTGGFSSFIPWSFKPGGSALGRQVQDPAHPARYVRVIAVARLVLDNFPHVQSSWFSENPTAGQLGLLAGADDFGGILVEENVLREAGHARTSTLDMVLALIRKAGFTPARRDSYYRFAERYERIADGNLSRTSP